MSLNYDLGEIQDYKNLCYLPDEVDEDGKETFSINPVTRALTFHAMSIGMREITKKNWKEFFIRVAALEAVEGASLHKSGASYPGEMPTIPRPITKEDVVNHIGLATNVTTRHASEFHKILAKNLYDSEELADRIVQLIKTKLD